MPTPNIQLILQAQLTGTNNLLSPAPQIIQIDMANPTLGATVANYDPYFQAAIAGSSVPFPGGITTVWVAYVRNLSSTANVNVGITTPASGTVSTSVLLPGGVFLIFNPAESAGGVNSLLLTGVGGVVPCEVLVAA
jgi:hypothetical protein